MLDVVAVAIFGFSILAYLTRAFPRFLPGRGRLGQLGEPEEGGGIVDDLNFGGGRDQGRVQGRGRGQSRLKPKVVGSEGLYRYWRRDKV